MKIRRMSVGLVASVLFSLIAVVAAQQQPQQGPVSTDQSLQAQAAQDYWTPDRMATAIPMTPPERLVENLPSQQSLPVVSGNPGFVNGWQPGDPPYVERTQTFSRAAMSGVSNPMAFGVPPTNPLSGPYCPFQRWTMQGHYLAFPRDIHGKLFFTIPSGPSAGNYVCSASVIGRSTLATAGHCTSDGNGIFGTNFLFCPSYFQAGVHPSRGCWGWSQAWTTGRWHTGGDPDYDYACIVTPVTGTVHANKIGNITGWAGRAWNWTDVPVITFGYPAGAPFDGTIIQQTASVEWYNVDFTAGNQVSKVIGSDLTGGSSGGGWFLSWRAPGAEVIDTDNNQGTDPAGGNNGPYITGVNSHKRCAGSCFTPPTAVAGTFWQEMTSPPFRLDAADNQDSEDIFALCLAHANNTAAPASANTAAVAKGKAAVAIGQK
jgi:hypothetical protein